MENAVKNVIANLPIEVLNIIFRCINKSTDKVTLAKIHPLLENAFSYHLGELINDHQWWKFMPIEEFYYCMSLCGAKIKSLNFEHNEANEKMKVAVNFCPNLEKLGLDIDDDYCDIASISDSLKKLKQLKVIKLNKSADSTNLGILAETLGILPNLKELTLIKFSFDEACCITNLPQLEKLQMFSHNQFLCWNLIFPPKLIYFPILKVFAAERMPLCLNWPCLESLRIESLKFSTIEGFPYLPKLKFLEIANTEITIDVIFKDTIHLYGNQMEELKFLGHSVDVPEATFIGNNFKVLKRLDCTLMNNESIPYIGQLKTLESLKLNFSRNLTVQSLINLLLKCTRIRRLELYKSFPINSAHGFVGKLIKTIKAIGVTSDQAMVLTVDHNYENLMKELQSIGESKLLTIEQFND